MVRMMQFSLCVVCSVIKNSTIVHSNRTVKHTVLNSLIETSTIQAHRRPPLHTVSSLGEILNKNTLIIITSISFIEAWIGQWLKARFKHNTC